MCADCEGGVRGMKVTKDFLQVVFFKYPYFCEEGVIPARISSSVPGYQEARLSNLIGSWIEIEAAAKWLNRFPKQTRFNEKQRAYRLKHVFEEDVANGGVYLCNGDFILAGLLAGFKIKEYRRGSGDICFNMKDKINGGI